MLPLMADAFMVHTLCAVADKGTETHVREATRVLSLLFRYLYGSCLSRVVGFCPVDGRMRKHARLSRMPASAPRVVVLVDLHGAERVYAAEVMLSAARLLPRVALLPSEAEGSEQAPSCLEVINLQTVRDIRLGIWLCNNLQKMYGFDDELKAVFQDCIADLLRDRSGGPQLCKEVSSVPLKHVIL